MKKYKYAYIINEFLLFLNIVIKWYKKKLADKM